VVLWKHRPGFKKKIPSSPKPEPGRFDGSRMEIEPIGRPESCGAVAAGQRAGTGVHPGFCLTPGDQMPLWGKF